MKFESLTYLQKIRIVQQAVECCDNTYILDILNDEEVWDEIKQHPDWLSGTQEQNPLIWKDLLNEAEWDIKAKWAFYIYLAVKFVLDKGDNLT